jgi:hypothetical protein
MFDSGHVIEYQLNLKTKRRNRAERKQQGTLSVLERAAH